MPCVGNMTLQPLDVNLNTNGAPYTFPSSFLIEERAAPIRTTPAPIPRAHGDSLQSKRYLGSKQIMVKGWLYSDQASGETLEAFFTQLLAFYNSVLYLEGRLRLVLPRERFVYVTPQDIQFLHERGDPSTRGVTVTFFAPDPLWYTTTLTTWAQSGIDITTTPPGAGNTLHYTLALDTTGWPERVAIRSSVGRQLVVKSSNWNVINFITIDAYRRRLITSIVPEGDWSLYDSGAFFPLIGGTENLVQLFNADTGVVITPPGGGVGGQVRGAYYWLETVPTGAEPTGPALWDRATFDVGTFG